MNSLLAAGIALAVLSGLMNGTFTLPIRYLGKWSWESVWTVFIVVACLVMPVVMFLATVSRPLAVLSAAPAREEVIAIATGFTWGFGAVMYRQGVSALGTSMGNTLVLLISAPLGSFLPMLIFTPERLRQPPGEFLAMLYPPPDKFVRIESGLELPMRDYAGGVAIPAEKGVPVFNGNVILGKHDSPHGEERKTHRNLKDLGIILFCRNRLKFLL
jgi:hypothetical protein